MAKNKESVQVRIFKLIAQILGLYALPAPRKLISGNGNERIITHRLLLAPSKSFERAIEECEKYDTATGKAVSFCLKRQDGNYAIDLDQNQLGMLTRSGFRMDQLVKVATGQTFNATVELRLEGDEVPNVRTGDMIPINSNHAVIQAPSITLSDNVAQRLRIEDSVAAQIASAMLSGIGAPSATQTQAAPAAPSMTSTDLEEFPEEEVEASHAGQQKPVRVRDQRKANAANTKVK